MPTIRIIKVPDSPLYALRADYFSKALVEHSKAVPGMGFRSIIGGGKGDSVWSMRNVWVGYPDAVAAVAARLTLKGVGVSDQHVLPEPESWRTSRSPYLFSTKGLRPYQVEGVRFLLMRAQEGALLADGMRLGKSCQATIAARAFKSKTLIVCPSHAVGVWGRPPESIEGPGEIAKWWPDVWKAHPESGARGVACLESVKPFEAQKVSRVLRAKKEELAKHDKELSAPELRKLQAAQAEIISRAVVFQDTQVLVCHYDILYAWTDVLIEWGVELLILDEGHLISGYKSRRSDELKTIRESVDRCIGLTGTPVTNLPKNLHNLLEILSPGRFGYFFAASREGCYARVFCDSHEKTVGKGETQKTVWDHKGKSNLDVPDGIRVLTSAECLKTRVSYLMLRRVKKDVDPQLPAKERQIIDIEIPARAIIQVTHRHLSGDPRELRRILDLAADAKLPTVVELTAGHVAEREKVICVCHRREYTEVVAKKVKKKSGPDDLVVWVHGGISQKERDKRIHSLRVHDGPGALVCTYDTCSTAIDLSFAAGEVMGELVWEFDVIEQMEERPYAFGKGNKPFYQYVIARGTGDELILKGLIDKLDNAERLGTSGKDGLKEGLKRKNIDAMKALNDALLELSKPREIKKGRRRG